MARQRRKLCFFAAAFHRLSSTSRSWCTGRFPWSCCSADHGVSTVAFLVLGGRCPWYAGRAGTSLCATTCALHTCSSSTRSSSSISWRRGCFPWSVCSSRPSRFPIAVYGGRCPCCAGRAYPLSWRRGRFTWSRLLVGPQIIPSCVWTRWSMPYFQVVRVPRVPSWRGQLCSHSCTC